MHRDARLSLWGRQELVRRGPPGRHRRCPRVDRAPGPGPSRPEPPPLDGPAHRATGQLDRNHRPGELVHIDLKKLARVPDGGGHKMLGRTTETKRRARSQMGHTHIHTAIDADPRLAYSEFAGSENTTNCVAFLERAVAWFTAQGAQSAQELPTHPPPSSAKCHTPSLRYGRMFGLDGSGDVASGPATAPRSLRALTAGLARAIDGLVDADTEGVSDSEVAEAMLGLRREQARLAAVVAEQTAVFEARGVYGADGSRSATDRIAVHGRLPRGQVAGELRDARRLRTMPETRAAFRSGDLSAAHVRALARLAGHPRAGAHFPDGEAHLVDEARRLRFDDWERLCGYWRDAADPDGPEQRHGRDQDLRRFRIGVGLDGVGHADGHLTPLAADAVNAVLAQIERELFDNDWAAAKVVHGDDTTVAHLARTAAQRRHDALVEMAIRATTAPADGKRPAPLVTVMVDFDTFAGRVCELAAGTVIAPGAVAELLGHDETLIQRVVAHGANRVRDISSARSFRGILRRVLEVVHRRCDHETCFVPAARCEGDHIVAWSAGGATTQDNGRLGCDFHNRWWYATRRSHAPPDEPDEPGADLAPTLDDDPGTPVVGSGDGATRTDARCVLRIAVPGVPDLRLDDSTSQCAVVLPQRPRPAATGWRDYRRFGSERGVRG